MIQSDIYYLMSRKIKLDKFICQQHFNIMLNELKNFQIIYLGK